MTKPRKSLLKLLVFLILSLALVLAAVIFAFGGDRNMKKTVKNPSITSPPSSQKPSKSDQDKTSSLGSLVKETFSLSKEGKVAHTPFISGKTEIKEIHTKWGEPNQITETASGIYEEYGNHHVVVGYHDELVNDIRSYDSGLKSIPLNEIKKIGGEPDEVRYYKDSTHDQMIFVYHVTSKYDLKWILPKQTDQEPNPKVDHISVYTEVKKQSEISSQSGDPNRPDFPNQSDDQNKSSHKKSISEIISGMSLDEKIGQMIIGGISGVTVDTHTKNLISKYKVGGLIFYSNNLVNTQQTVHLLNGIKSENVPNPLPLLLSVDQEGGSVSRLPGGLINFPTNKVIGEINNSQFSYKVGSILGRELKGFGFNLDFAPVLDVNSNPHNPVIGNRSFGNNPEIVSKLGIQTMKGIQSQNIISTIKHFPGHGDTDVDSHLELPIVNKTLTQLKKLELIPFERAINHGADVVMVAHILLPKLDDHFPASMSKKIMTEILRKQLNFSGVVITDDMTMKAITNHFTIGRAAVESVKAGSDIILVAHDYNSIIETVLSLKTAVQKGEIPEQRINDSVRRIIQIKRKYEINNSQLGNVNIGEINQSINKLLAEYTK
ncbi:beta-N-acetylhexosaminidase [Bacillus sp. UNC438CL73TsuS30]|uniref:beta-N-acetylhexosaminidase n=1 Tax=Bacillus sp. UNC438CL73TsuS30 TaxID=1340434 RepID=UPI00047B39D4|nr:beta-N-acetylhexosaminidase [Bacillus sp. UNC438CL73TsuS30]